MRHKSTLSSTVLGMGLTTIAALGLSACSDADDPDGTTTTSAVGTTATVPNTPKPTVVIPDTPAPATLQTKDLKVGTGAEARSGQKVALQYVGVGYQSKKEFDSSYKRNQPISFVLGVGRVIPGWDQ